jgi:hypothetical protein
MTDVQTVFTIASALVVVIVAICEASKAAGVPSRFIPLISVVLGICGVWVFDHVNFLSTLAGVILGLATTGGYRLIKTSILNK